MRINIVLIEYTGNVILENVVISHLMRSSKLASFTAF